MLIIEYTPIGNSYSDFEVEDKAKEIIESHIEYMQDGGERDMLYRVSSEILFTAIRTYLAENQIDPSSWLQYKYGDEIMETTASGNPSVWAKGFLNIEQDLLRRSLKARIKNMTDKKGDE